MDLRFGLFIHFGINTFNDVEWSDGTLDPKTFDPTDLDTDGWCAAAKAAGMTFVCPITKHHDGFCNWPTQETDYSVSASPFGEDVLARIVASARKHGLKVAFYYSLWDRHEPTHDQDDAAYADFMKRQLTELLTNYGDIVEIWFDGMWKKQKEGWGSAEGLMAAWQKEGRLRWHMDGLYAHIKSLQPDCIVLNNTTTAFPGIPIFPVDARTGEKVGGDIEDQKVWQDADKPAVYLPLQIETTLSAKGKEKFKSGSWFWHDWDHSCRSREEILNLLDVAEHKNAVLLLNAGPSTDGKLRSEDDERLRSLGE